MAGTGLGAGEGDGVALAGLDREARAQAAAEPRGPGARGEDVVPGAALAVHRGHGRDPAALDRKARDGAALVDPPALAAHGARQLAHQGVGPQMGVAFVPAGAGHAVPQGRLAAGELLAIEELGADAVLLQEAPLGLGLLHGLLGGEDLQQAGGLPLAGEAVPLEQLDVEVPGALQQAGPSAQGGQHRLGPAAAGGAPGPAAEVPVEARPDVDGGVRPQHPAEHLAHHAGPGEGQGVTRRDQPAVPLRGAAPRPLPLEHPHAAAGVEQGVGAGEADHPAADHEDVDSIAHRRRGYRVSRRRVSPARSRSPRRCPAGARPRRSRSPRSSWRRPRRRRGGRCTCTASP